MYKSKIQCFGTVGGGMNSGKKNINLKATGLMSIAMFGHKHMLSREGGIEVVVNELAIRMAEKGHKVVCYDRRTKHISGGVIDSRRKVKGVRIIPVWTLEMKGLAALTSSISAAIKAGFSDAEIVHIHAEGPAAMSKLIKFFRKRVVVTVHGLDWKRAKWGGAASWYIKFGERVAVRNADEIIVLSKSVQEYFWKQYHRKTTFIPNGVTKPEIVDAKNITDKWGLVKDEYVLYLGRIVPEKGIEYLINAWKNIKTNKKLVIAGGASDTQQYMEYLKSISDPETVFTGFQQGRELQELFSNAYIYCLPSDLEGMPLSLLEAMSYGNCCVVSDIPECTEVVGDSAVTFKKSNVDDLERVLQNLIDNPQVVSDYKRISSDYIVSKYNWDDVANHTLELYKGKEG